MFSACVSGGWLSGVGRSYLYRSCIWAVMSLVISASAFAQCIDPCGPNLITNPGFEETTSFCSGTNGQLYTDQTPVLDWYGTAGVNSPNSGITPDNFNSNCNGNSSSNGCGSGMAAVGVFTATGSGNAREYIQSQLISPLEAGAEYCFTLDVWGNPSNNPNDGLGIWFTDEAVDITTQNGGASFIGPGSAINAQPHWQLPSGDLISTCTTRSGTFCATGDDSWIVIGNFRDDANTTTGGGIIPIGYLIMDNLLLTKVCPTTPALELIVSATQLACGESATIEASGGGGNYVWTPNIGTGPGPFSVSPLETTVYTVSSEVVGNCGSYSGSVETIVEVEPCGHFVTVLGGEVCPGECMELLAVLNSANDPPYTITWSNGIPDGLGPHSVCPTLTTSYEVTATDANGISATSQVTVALLPVPELSLSSTDLSCADDASGSATVSASGSSAPYTHVWNTQPQQNGSVAIGLPAGSYTVTTTDGNGCSSSSTVAVVEPSTLELSITSTAATCGLQDGSATAMPSGGSAPYTYAWSTTPAQSTASISGLSAGSYSLVVSDANGCTASASTVVSSPEAGDITVEHNDVSCNGAEDGSATATVVNGSAPFTYAWNTTPVQTTATATGLPAGTWTVTVTASDGCVGLSAVTVSEPPMIVVQTYSEAASCGLPNGSASVVPSGGTGPYQVIWDSSPPQSTTTASALTPGNYTVTVTDATACSVVNIVSVANSGGPTAGFIAADGCMGDVMDFTNTSTGAISWLWDMGDGTIYAQEEVQHSFTASGTYTVLITVSDAAGCVDSYSAPLTVSAVPLANFSVSPLAGCAPLVSSFVNTQLQPGSTCLWQFGDGSTSTDCGGATHTYVQPGCFDVALSVSLAGCSSEMSVADLICVTAGPEADFTMAPNPITSAAPLVSYYNMSSNATSYEWTFSGGSPASSSLLDPVVDHSGNEPGFYQVCLVASNLAGCADSTCKVLSIMDELRVHVPNSFTPDGDGINDIFLPVLVGHDLEQYALYIFDRWGNEIYHTNDASEGWNGQFRNTDVQDGVYIWKLMIRSASGAGSEEFIGHVTLLR